MEKKENFRHNTAIQIRFNDLDILGHVNNAVYQHYFDLARMEYFSLVIGKNLEWNKFGVIMAGISIDYFAPVKIDDIIRVRSRIDLIGEKSLQMTQEIYDAESNEIKARNQATMVGYSAEKNESLSIPETWREKIFAFEDKVSLKYPAQTA